MRRSVSRHVRAVKCELIGDIVSVGDVSAGNGMSVVKRGCVRDSASSFWSQQQLIL